MSRAEIKAQLEQLLELLQEERKRAKALDMAGLQQVVEAKGVLVESLKFQPEEAVGFEDLLREIDEENRRNAFLLWTGLNWVRDLMGFFGKAEMPQIYGDAGQSRTLTQGGRLLSGKV
jgi:flagellar biosynthesis/type III secretory pathway chaperone